MSPCAHQGDQRREHEGRDQAARDHDRRLPVAEDVAHGEQGRRDLQGELRLGQHAGRASASSDWMRTAAPRASLMAAPTARPMKIQRPPLAPVVVARSTSAQAVPSG